MKKHLKYGICSAAIITSAILGDAADLIDRAYYPIVYRDVPIRNETYGKPFSIRKRYIIRDGLLEVQIGDESSNEYYPVMEGLRVNERKMHEQFTDTAGDVMDSISRRTSGLIDKIKQAYDNLRKRR